MEKYIIKFAYERDINYFMWEVKRKTAHWAIPPKIRRNDRTIEFGNAFVYLTTHDKYMIGRHDHIKVSADSVFYAIDVFNEKLRLGHQEIFDK